MSTTLSTLMLRVGRRLTTTGGDKPAVVEVDTSANSSSTTTITAVRLGDYFAVDDGLSPYVWARLPDGPDDTNLTSQERRVSTAASNYAASTGVVTVATAFSTDADNRVDTGKALQMWAINPDRVRQAVLDALRTLSPGTLHLWVRDETLYVDNLLANNDYESAIVGGAHPSWTNAGAGITVTAETTIVMHGSQSAKIVAGGGAAGQMYQAVTINVKELTGKSLTLLKWVYATAADTARIRLSFDGGSTFEASHAYHSGKDQWELQKLTATVPTTASSVRAYNECVAAGTGYFDSGALWVNGRHIRRYTAPTSLYTYNKLTVQADEDDPTEGLYLPVGGRPPAGRILRLEGKGPLTAPTADASSTELDGDRAELVAVHAALTLARTTALFGECVPSLTDEYNALLARPGVRMWAGAQDRTWWSVEEGSTRYVRLHD